MAALISSVMNTKDKVPFYVAACHDLNIDVLPPDVNTSMIDFAVVEGKIRFGLNAVKNVGESACRAIVRARDEGGAFSSIWDFTERVDPQTVNKRALESLVKCGALDSTGASRMGMLGCLEQALAWGQKQQSDKLLGQGSIFDLGEAEGDVAPRHHPAIAATEFEKNELLKLEKETLGLYVSDHPLTPIRDQLRRKTDCAVNEIERRRDGEVVIVGGIIASLKQMTTKKGEPMVFAGLEDVTGSCEVVAFSSVYVHARELLMQDRVVIVKGRVDHKQQGETKLVAIEVTAFEATPERREVRLKVDARIAAAGIVRELAALVKDFPGEAPASPRAKLLGPTPVAGSCRRVAPARAAEPCVSASVGRPKRDPPGARSQSRPDLAFRGVDAARRSAAARSGGPARAAPLGGSVDACRRRPSSRRLRRLRAARSAPSAASRPLPCVGERAESHRPQRRSAQHRDRRPRRPRQDDPRRRAALAGRLLPREPGRERARHGLDRPRAREGHHDPRQEHGGDRRRHEVQHHRHAWPRRFRRRGGARPDDGRRRPAARRRERRARCRRRDSSCARLSRRGCRSCSS